MKKIEIETRGRLLMKLMKAQCQVCLPAWVLYLILNSFLCIIFSKENSCDCICFKPPPNKSLLMGLGGTMQFAKLNLFKIFLSKARNGPAQNRMGMQVEAMRLQLEGEESLELGTKLGLAPLGAWVCHWRSQLN